MNEIASNVARVRETIATTALAAGRKPEDITLIAVSKTHPAASLQAAWAAGQRVFGESAVQEALGKIAHFADRGLAATSDAVPEWHFIGYLQSNKARFIPGNFSWMHSLDSIRLAQRLSRLAREKDVVINTLVEVNVTRDPRKHGIAPPEVFPLLEQLLEQNLPGIALRGLMTIGPYPAKEAEIRHAYTALRRLRDACLDRYALPAFSELSMGMSGDYVEAIKEGSTMLRIGTAIFGARDYSE